MKLFKSLAALKQLYRKVYKQRLSPEIFPQEDLSEIHKMKENLWKVRKIMLDRKISQPWNLKDIELAIQKLKANKSKDPNGWINEIFKSEVCGQNLKEALVMFYNTLKNEMFIPNFMNYSNITSIKKRKSKKLNIDNMRAIFSLIIFKKISDNLLLNDLYKDIDENMTNANIG